MSKQVIYLYAVLLIIFGISSTAAAQEADKTLSPYFSIESDEPGLDRLPLKSTKVDVNISGVVSEVIVTQEYTNEGTRPIEAIYTFPASTRAAIHGMKMLVGDRVIDAKIKEKGKAKKIYEQAKEKGKRTSLLEQKRPNVFQMNVANIMPGDRVRVVLSYTELLIPTEGVYEFVYPTVVGPRYSNETSATVSKDNHSIASPYSKNGIASSATFDLNMHLAAGMPLQRITSKSHKVDISYMGLDRANINLNSSSHKEGNRDFILNYQLAGGKIESGLLLYEGQQENFFTLMIQPPKRVLKDQIPPREYIFVVDVSGSMHGFPLDISKNLLRNLISNLRPTDRFNVILFASTSYMMAETSLSYNEANIALAMETIDSKRGGGGTELLPALKKALDLPRCEIGLSRSIVIVTDGYISVEKEAYDLIQNNLNQSNLFAFGIGSGVNRYLIEGLAHVGMGEPFIITSSEDANTEAQKFRSYIESPVLTEISAQFGGFEVYDVTTTSIPDVLAERPVVIYGKWKGKPKGLIAVKGFSGVNEYTKSFNVEEVVPDSRNSGLKYIWAREKIKLLDDYKLVDRNSNAIEQITKLGLDYNLMTAYTSFVAVDKVIANNGLSTAVEQVLPLPQGVSNAAVGFDLSIQGVVKKSKKVQQKIVVGAFDCQLEEAEILLVKNTIAHLLSSEIAKSGLVLPSSTFNLQLTINSSGSIESFKLLDLNNNALEKLLKYIVIGWQIEDLNPTNTIQLILPINVL